jgi:hypothetical protein
MHPNLTSPPIEFRESYELPNRITKTLVLFILIATLVIAFAHAVPTSTQSAPVRADNSNSEESIKALELKLAQWIVQGNWDEYEKLLASDFTRISADGKLADKKSVISEFREGPRKIIVMEPEDMHARIYGDSAILQGRVTTSVRDSGHVNTRKERFTEVFVKQDGQWQLASEQETSIGK